jgi:hypothetical protein
MPLWTREAEKQTHDDQHRHEALRLQDREIDKQDDKRRAGADCERIFAADPVA